MTTFFTLLGICSLIASFILMPVFIVVRYAIERRREHRLYIALVRRYGDWRGDGE